jgi:hypothetical protein
MPVSHRAAKLIEVFAWAFFVVIELALVASFANDAYYDLSLGEGRAVASATITQIFPYEVATGKSSKQTHYAVVYRFSVAGVGYGRTNWFGLVVRASEVSASFAQSAKRGDVVAVFYRPGDPRINRPSWDDGNFWHLALELSMGLGLGALAFFSTRKD